MSAIEKVAKAIVSEAFEATQPNRGDVFSWIDEHAKLLARVSVLALADHFEKMAAGLSGQSDTGYRHHLLMMIDHLRSISSDTN